MPDFLLEPRTTGELLVVLGMVLAFATYSFASFMSKIGGTINQSGRHDIRSQAFIVDRLGMTMDELAEKVNQMDKLQFQIQTLTTENAGFRFQVKILQEEIKRQGDRLVELGETNQRQVRRIIILEYENGQLTARNRELALENEHCKGQLKESSA